MCRLSSDLHAGDLGIVFHCFVWDSGVGTLRGGQY